MGETQAIGVLEQLATWAVRPGKFSAQARRQAADAIIDTLACMIAGANDPVVLGLRRAFADEIADTGTAWLVGGGRSSAGRAALINGTAAHALDFDDNFRPARAHASAVLVPALLAVAAQRPVSGSALVAAYIVGLEAQAVIGRGVNNAHNLAGWHPTGTVATIGSAAGVAYLLGLDSAGIAASMANSVSMAAGLKGQFGTAMKPVHAGLAARGAVEAALLAAAGIHGNPAVLEQAGGFAELYGGPLAPGWTLPLAIGAPLSIESVGLVPKLYPCCGSTHYVLDMLYDLKRQHSFVATDVVAVEAHVGLANFRNLPYAAPQDGMQARFSMPYCVALALTQAHLTLDDFTTAAVIQPARRHLLALTTLTAYDAETERASTTPLPHRVRLTLRNGAVLQAERVEVRGSIGEPFGDDDKRQKFISCLGTAGLSKPRARHVYDQLLNLDAATDLLAVTSVIAEFSNCKQGGIE